MSTSIPPSASRRGLRALLASLAVIAGIGLVVGIPLAAYRLVEFLVGAALRGLFYPGLAIYVVVCAVVGFAHLARRARGQQPAAFTPMHPGRFVAATLAALILGQLLLLSRAGWLFWIPFICVAAAPALAPLAFAGRRIGPVTTWRRVLLAIITGSLLSTVLAIALGASVELIVYAVVAPVRAIIAEIVASPEVERVFFSPALVLASLSAVVVAPLVEEVTKPLAVILLGTRIQTRAEAFLLGMAGGAGFAVLENMLYESSSAWAGIGLVRAIGGVLHPMNAGLAAMGWYAVRQREPRAWAQLAGFYGLAAADHMFWNGGLALLYSAAGVYFFGDESWTVSIYGIGQPLVVLVLLVLESAALWRLLILITDQLADPADSHEIRPELEIGAPRRLALITIGLFFAMTALGLLYAPLVQKYWARLTPLT